MSAINNGHIVGRVIKVAKKDGILHLALLSIGNEGDKKIHLMQTANNSFHKLLLVKPGTLLAVEAHFAGHYITKNKKRRYESYVVLDSYRIIR